MPKAAVIITADKAVRKQAYKCFTKPADVMNNVAHAYYYFFAKVEEQGMLSADFNQSWPHIIAHVINIEENQKL